MGTDIHLFVEKFNPETSKWEWVREVPEQFRDLWYLKLVAENPKDQYWQLRAKQCFYGTRNYDAFAILADVRNGRGFAGCKTGEGFIPISLPRGLPENLSEELKAAIAEDEKCNSDEQSPIFTNFGDHSQSWVTLAELQRIDWLGETLKIGVVKYNDWAPNAVPTEYCGDVMGRDIVTLNALSREAKLSPDAIQRIREAAKDQIRVGKEVYLRVSWFQTVEDLVGDLKTRLIPALESLGGHPEQVRIVFGFDS